MKVIHKTTSLSQNIKEVLPGLCFMFQGSLYLRVDTQQFDIQWTTSSVANVAKRKSFAVRLEDGKLYGYDNNFPVYPVIGTASIENY